MAGNYVRNTNNLQSRNIEHLERRQVGHSLNRSFMDFVGHSLNWFYMLINSPSLWPRACQIMNNVLLTLILYIASISNLFLEDLQLKRAQTKCSIFLKRTIKTSSNNTLSSNCCFLFEKCAREAFSLGASGDVHNCLGTFGKRILEWKGRKISLKPAARTSVNKCQKRVSKYSPN